VTVGRRNLAGQNHLVGAGKRARRLKVFAKSGVAQDEDSAIREREVDQRTLLV
jgi:hypothetical protein